MAESNSRWPAYAQVPPFLPVPLRARADGWTLERQSRFIGHLAESGFGRLGELRPCLDTVVALRRGKSRRDVDFPKRKVTPEELGELAHERPVHVTLRRSRFVRAQRRLSASAPLRHLRRFDALAVRRGWSGKVTAAHNSTLPPVSRQHGQLRCEPLSSSPRTRGPSAGPCCATPASFASAGMAKG